MSSEKTSRDSLKELLCDALGSRERFRCIEGVNPCLITLNGIEFWIYQKNITSTAFNKDSDQSDVNRIQLPERATFQYNPQNEMLPFHKTKCSETQNEASSL